MKELKIRGQDELQELIKKIKNKNKIHRFLEDAFGEDIGEGILDPKEIKDMKGIFHVPW